MSAHLDDKPAYGTAAVTPSDSTALNFRSLYIGTGGNVAITDKVGNVTTFSNVLGGSILPVQGTKVMATNTTASNIVALW